MTLQEIFQNPYITQVVVKALVVGILVALCASLLGVSLVLKRLSMIGDGLSHVGFGALAVATVLELGDYSLEISIPIVVAAAFLLIKIGESKRLKGDAAIALFSTGAVAVGSLIYNYSGSRNTDICNSLFGSASIITLDDKDLILSIVLSVAVLLFFVLCYNRIFAITFDEAFSRAAGIRAELFKLMIAVLTAITIVLGMKMLGAIMISAIIIFPALSAMRVCRSFRSVVICSAVLSVTCFVIGFFAACRLSYQTGATVACVDLVAFMLFALAGVFINSSKGKALLASAKKLAQPRKN
ncbi:MAG: metal ABC transporter permease [Ruminococcaceae bacterium]|nr:metal ABC transporter permease [Oscillospiraceae bacterium]